MLVMNVAGERSGYAAHVARLLEVFDERVIAIPVREDGNHIVFAFRDPAFAPRWHWMRSQALALQAGSGWISPPSPSSSKRANARATLSAWRVERRAVGDQRRAENG